MHHCLGKEKDEMKRCFRMILNIVIPLLGLCLVIFLGPRLLHFFMPFVVGWILALLGNHCEEFIRFLEENRELITDKKIFGGEN